MIHWTKSTWSCHLRMPRPGFTWWVGELIFCEIDFQVGVDIGADVDVSVGVGVEMGVKSFIRWTCIKLLDFDFDWKIFYVQKSQLLLNFFRKNLRLVSAVLIKTSIIVKIFGMAQAYLSMVQFWLQIGYSGLNDTV